MVRKPKNQHARQSDTFRDSGSKETTDMIRNDAKAPFSAQLPCQRFGQQRFSRARPTVESRLKAYSCSSRNQYHL
jgi:hypothetical protein